MAPTRSCPLHHRMVLMSGHLLVCVDCVLWTHRFVMRHSILDYSLALWLGQESGNRSLITADVHDSNAVIVDIRLHLKFLLLIDWRFLIHLDDLLVDTSLYHLLHLILEEIAITPIGRPSSISIIAFIRRGERGDCGQCCIFTVISSKLADRLLIPSLYNNRSGFLNSDIGQLADTWGIRTMTGMWID